MLFVSAAGTNDDNAADVGPGQSLHYQNVPGLCTGLALVLRCAQAPDEHDRCAGELTSKA